MVPVFTKLCQLVTKDLFEFSSVKPIYSEEEVDKLNEAIADVLEDEDGWLEAVYGVKSTLPNATWVEKVVKEGKWVFDSTALRNKIFQKAGLDTRHIR